MLAAVAFNAFAAPSPLPNLAFIIAHDCTYLDIVSERFEGWFNEKRFRLSEAPCLHVCYF